MSTDNMQLNCWKYITNGIVVAYFDGGKTPGVGDIKGNWRYIYNGIQLTDGDIRDIIDRVSKFYQK